MRALHPCVREEIPDHSPNCFIPKAPKIDSLSKKKNKHTLVCNTSDNHFCFSFPFPREEDDPSHCAVPISTSLIKQIATKIHPGGTVTQILDEFYGPEKFLQPTWPYNKKDSDR